MSLAVELLASTAMEIYPRPRQVRRFDEGKGDAVATAPTDSQPSIVLDSNVARQGYELSICADAIEVRHSDDAGLAYAQDTLSQIRNQYPDRLPTLKISDWPDTPNRAYMLDISRDRVPTMETLQWLVDALSASRFNQLQLYTEHTFAFQEHEVVWRNASPMTSVEMTELDELCVAKGIELVPCLNVFGHMGPWLRHQEYQDRAECPEGFEMPVLGNHVNPLTLAPNQANADFALELIRELTETVTSKKVNINCDEPMELGLGQSRLAVEERGKGEVFVDHLLRIMEPLIADGHEVMFWGDMFRIHPESLARVPREMATALAWQYDPPSELGTGQSSLASTPELAEMFGIPPDMHLGFESQTRQLVEAEYPFWAAPGTGSWNSLIGRWPHAKANLLDAVDVALQSGATGFILTDWGDTGHMQPLSVSVLPIVFGGAIAWCAESNRDLPVAKAASRVVFGDQSGLLAQALETLGGLGEECGRTGVNGSALFFDLILRPPFAASGSITLEELDVVLGRLDSSADQVSRSSPACTQGEEIKRELLAAIRLARHGALRIGRLAGIDGPDDASMHQDLAEAIEKQRVAWLGRSRVGGLAHSLRLLQRTLKTYQAS